MYGDQSGSPRRDSRQDDASPPITEDVKVAGAPIAGPGGYHADDQGHPTALSPMRAEQQPYEPLSHGQDAHEQTAFEQTTVDQNAPYQGGGQFGGPPEGPPPGPGEFDGTDPGPRRSLSPKFVKIAAVAAAAVVIGGGSAGAWAMAGNGGAKKGGDGSAQAQAQVPAPAPLTDEQRSQAEAERRKELKKRAARAAREDKPRPHLVVKGKAPATKTPSSDTESDPDVPSGSPKAIAKGMLSDYGWSSSQFGCLDRLWMRESGWNVHAANPSSGAYGIPQALPGSKMSTAGSDWRNNPRTQIKWGLGYIKDRYGSPCGAWSHSQSSGWY